MASHGLIFALLVWLLILGLTVHQVVGDFGDYVDPTFNCPAVTTCPVVCVPRLEDCPSSLQCQTGTSLCQDGTCKSDCAEANASYDWPSPCPFECAPIACAKTKDYYDDCQSMFESYYNFSKTCAAQELENAVDRFSMREPLFIGVYFIVTSITALMFAWCAFNQRRSPVAGSTKPLWPDQHNSNSHADKSMWTQTGYLGFNLLNPVGAILYLAIMINLVGLQIFLAGLTFSYYNQPEESPETLYICKIFQITWVIAFSLTFIMKWPTSIQSLFYRRALLQEATHVAVFTPLEVDKTVDEDIGIQKRLLVLQQHFHSIMAFIFSEVHLDRQKGEVSYCRVQQDHGTRYFIFRLRRYSYDPTLSMFVPGQVQVGDTLGDFMALSKGLDPTEVIIRRQVVGYNTIQVRKPFLPMNIIKEFSKPFYTYQLFLVWAWYPFNFYYMATVQAFIIISGGLTVAFFLYRNERNLYRLSHVEGTVDRLSGGTFQTCSQRDLVPGDVVQLFAGPIYADMVLLQGTDVLVDESALTGESTPMAKTAIDMADAESMYSHNVHKRHSILAGTNVIEVGGKAVALVIKTGSYTAKGELLRDVLSFRRHKFKFDTQVKLVLLILLVYAIMSFVIAICLLKDYFSYKWFYGMYIVGTALPPLLPTVFTVSVGVSDDRLARKRIACSNSDGILVAGKVDRVFFDKTGTLTKQGLDFLYATDLLDRPMDYSYDRKPTGYLKIAMATCHSLTVTSSNVIVGNQVDINMFQAVRGVFVEPNQDYQLRIQVDNGTTYTILKRFDFDHHRMVMSVIIQDEAGNIHAFVKGSGDSIKRYCDISTIPSQYDKYMNDGARKGTYQIALSMKTLSNDQAFDVSNLSRDDIEKDLTFIGVINFKNLLREETSDVIRELKEGGIVSAIITGDSVLTGICIARECGIIHSGAVVLLGKAFNENDCSIEWVNDNDEIIPDPTAMTLSDNTVLAVTGNVWDRLWKQSKTNAMSLAKFIRVYGRCTPINKADIVTAFVDQGHVCCMCGDGGNDCGALKTAHVGIALSDADASTVSPFTSLDKSITAVVDVIKEGRCALASAFAAYKYMILYGQIETLTQLINAYFSISLSEWCWLFMDGVWMMTMAFTLPLAKAHNKLSPKLPVGDLLGIHTMSSVLGVLSINIIFTFIALVTLWNSSFFQCRRWSSKNVSNVTTIGDNYEASVLFLVTGYQYISTAMAFNYGYCFRAGFLKNRVFVLLAVGFTVIHFIITVYPGDLSCLWRVNCTNDHVQRGITTGFQPLPINNPFNTTVMPVSFRWTLIVIIISNTIAVQCWEVFFINGVGLKWEESYQQSNITPISDLVNPVKTDDEVDDLELAHVPVQSAVKA